MMNKETNENALSQFPVYRDVELSEQQIENGQFKDARIALTKMHTKYTCKLPKMILFDYGQTLIAEQNLTALGEPPPSYSMQ